MIADKTLAFSGQLFTLYLIYSLTDQWNRKSDGAEIPMCCGSLTERMNPEIEAEERGATDDLIYISCPGMTHEMSQNGLISDCVEGQGKKIVGFAVVFSFLSVFVGGGTTFTRTGKQRQWPLFMKSEI